MSVKPPSRIKSKKTHAKNSSEYLIQKSQTSFLLRQSSRFSQPKSLLKTSNRNDVQYRYPYTSIKSHIKISVEKLLEKSHSFISFKNLKAKISSLTLCILSVKHLNKMSIKISTKLRRNWSFQLLSSPSTFSSKLLKFC